MTLTRILLITGAILLVLILVVAGVFAATFMGRRAIVDGQEVKGARVVVDGFGSLAMIPVEDRAVMLVDAGEDTSGAPILAELSRRGLSPDAVAAVLITHGHPDHIGAVRLFPKALVMALEREISIVEGREGTHGPLTRLFGVSPTGIKVTRPLHDGESFSIGRASVRVFAVPGHTAGSAAYVVNDVLFIGDSADVDSAGGIRGAAWIFSDSQDENRASLRRLATRLTQENIAVRAIVPAHSGIAEGLEPLTAFVQSE